jgi:hypothetical protein
MKSIKILLLSCVLYACQGEASFDNLNMSTASQEADYAGQAYEESEQSKDNFQAEDRKIIKTASIRFQVKDLKASTQKIEEITKAYEGFMSSMNQTNSNYAISNSLSVKIPSEKLDAFLTEIEKESIYTNYTRIDAQDVTEEYVDITGRLATKKEVRDRYVEVLRKKAQTVEDILNAEEKIRVIQEEIESIEGRLKYLNSRTALSTVNIEIYQEVAYVKAPDVYKKPFFTKVAEGFVNGWGLIQNIVVGLISIWPIVLILVFLFLMRKRIKNSLKK